MSGLTTAASGLTAGKKTLDACANNMANMNTDSFKKRFTINVDQPYHIYQGIGAPTSSEGTLNPSGTYIGTGVQTIAVAANMEQGDIEITDNPLDVAVQGEGFFQVELPSGEIGYTRDGRFTLSAERQIITLEGYKVKPDLTIPAHTTGFEINKQGQVYAHVQGENAPVLVGQFEMSVFPNPRALEPLGNNLFKHTMASGEPTTGAAGSIGFGHLMQNAVEKSNVNPVVELTNLIEAQRAYAMNTKVMNACEEMDRNLETIMR